MLFVYRFALCASVLITMKTVMKKIWEIFIRNATSSWMSGMQMRVKMYNYQKLRLHSILISLQMLYDITEPTFYYSISKLFFSNLRAWPYVLSSRSAGSSQNSPSESNVSTIIVYACKFQTDGRFLTHRWSNVSHENFYKMNLTLTQCAAEKTAPHICSEKEIINLASYEMNENGVDIGERLSWETDYKQPTYKTEGTNQTLQVLPHSRESE